MYLGRLFVFFLSRFISDGSKKTISNQKFDYFIKGLEKLVPILPKAVIYKKKYCIIKLLKHIKNFKILKILKLKNNVFPLSFWKFSFSLLQNFTNTLQILICKFAKC